MGRDELTQPLKYDSHEKPHLLESDLAALKKKNYHSPIKTTYKWALHFPVRLNFY